MMADVKRTKKEKHMDLMALDVGFINILKANKG